MVRRIGAVLGLVLTVLLLPFPVQAQTTEDLFDSAFLHALYLDLNPADWQKLKQNYLENTYYEANMRWTFEGRDIEVRRVGIRSRGSASRSPVKPGLGIDFTRYVSSQRFLGLKALTLRNNTQDGSMMREVISMALLKRMGVAVSRESYARLYVNGQYAGLYSMVESIDSEFLNRNFGESGGYLYSVDRATAEDPLFLFADKGADPSVYMPLPLKPENHSSDPEPGPVVEMIQAINHIPDAAFSTVIPDYVDLKSTLTHLAAEAYLAEEDGIAGDYGTNNIYLYRFIGANQFRFIPWDKSNSFWELNRSIWINTDVNVLLRRALAGPELRTFFRNEILRAAAMSGWLESEISRIYGQIRTAALEDPYKQCYDSSLIMTNCPNERFESEAAFLGRFARERNNVVAEQLSLNSAEFGFAEGSASYWMNAPGSQVTASFATIDMTSGSPVPAGLAVYSLRQNGVLVSETAVPVSDAMFRGQIWVEADQVTTTGVAIVNTSSAPATLSFYFRSADGTSVILGSTTIQAGSQISRLLNESPFNGPSVFSGSLFFTSSARVSVVAVRGRLNGRSEYIMTAIPVLNLDAASASPTIIPEFAQGGGWQTEVVLLNPTNVALAGSVEFWGQGTSNEAASPLKVTAGGVAASAFRFAIAPEGAFRLRLSNTPQLTFSGSVRIVPDSVPPFAFVSLASTTSGLVTSETVVSATQPTTAADVYVERDGTLDTAIALANPTGKSATAILELHALSGDGIGRVSTISLPANGQVATLLSQIAEFSALPDSFEGVLNISTVSSPGVIAVGIRLRTNERGELLAVAVPAQSESSPRQATGVFPLVVSRGGYATHLILSGNPASGYASGVLRTYRQPGGSGAPALENAEARAVLALTNVPRANPATAGMDSPNTLSPELTEISLAQGSTRLENTSLLTSYYGYANDVLAALPDFPKMTPDAGKAPTATERVEATKTDPDKNTYLVFRQTLHGADSHYNYGTHFLFQGHELGDAGQGYITRINLDADAQHRVTLMATKDVNGSPLPVFDGSMWHPFSQRLLFTAERGSSGGVWQATADFPSAVEDISGILGRGGYEGIQADNRGNLIIVEHVGGAHGVLYPHARQPNSFVYRFVPRDPADLKQGGKLQALQVLSKAKPGSAIQFGKSVDSDILSQDSRDLYTYGFVFQTNWITIHDTATQGSSPFDANAAAKAALATPFKSPENGQFRPGTNFTEFFFTTSGDNDALTEAGSDYGGFGGIFRIELSGSNTGRLTLFYKGDVAHTGFDNCAFWSATEILVGEDARDGLHAQRNALDSAYLFDLNTSYSSGAQPLRILAGGRDPSATIDSRFFGMPGFQNDGDNEITGIHISDGDPTVRGLLGAYAPSPFANGWRVFYTQQHGDNATWEILRSAR